jgi:Fic family protein
MSSQTLNLSAEAVAAREAANGLRQIDAALDMVDWYLEPGRPFSLRPPMLQQLQKIAVDGLEPDAGEFRKTPVRISKSSHEPPLPHLVQQNVVEMCEYVNNNWHEKTPFHLSAYVMWRLNWIHPFPEGNGLTSRALSYAVLCVKLGYRLPGSPTIPAQIQVNRDGYFLALESADRAWSEGRLELGAMEEMLKDMLAKQLLSVIEQATGNPV